MIYTPLSRTLLRQRKSIEQRFIENPNNIQKAVDNSRTSEEKYRSRIKQRVEHMIEQPYAYFFTYTLNDKSLDLDEKHHIKKIKATLPKATNISYSSSNSSMSRSTYIMSSLSNISFNMTQNGHDFIVNKTATLSID